MKKIIYSLAICFVLISFHCLFAQDVIVRDNTIQLCKQQEKNNPSVAKVRADLEKFTADYIAKHPPQPHPNSAPSIIPVVFHVLHEYGSENISKAQIQDAIRIMNEDFRRQNPDTGNTPAAFKPVAADCNIEFRLAQKDPNGNCTDGIEHIYSTRTNFADAINTFINQWPAYNYLNIYTVKSSATNVIGSTYYPGGPSQYDGIIILDSYVGTIGTATGNTYYTALTSLAALWMNIRHIWGDDGGACWGSDSVADTPNQGNYNTGCPTYPHYDSCTATGSGVMFMNYMDFTNGPCQNLFTAGQAARMAATFASSLGGRDSIITPTNLAATGTDGTAAFNCTPVPDFNAAIHYICAGDSVQFLNYTFNSDTFNSHWSFPGGNPSSSTLANPYVHYASSGIYTVTLRDSNSAGVNLKTDTMAVVVSGAPTLTGNYTNSFETAGTFPGNGGYVENPDNSPVYKWSRDTNVIAATGTACLKMTNDSLNHLGEVDSWITPAFDLTIYTGIQFKFKMAYAKRDTAVTDYLKIYYSTNCGRTWVLRYTKSGTALATVSGLISNYTPASLGDWRQESVSGLVPLNNKPNVRFKFEFTEGPDNNLYIDDINLLGLTVGIDEQNKPYTDISVFPIPFSTTTEIAFGTELTDAALCIYNVFGQKVKAMEHISGNLVIVNRENLSSGIYLFDITVKERKIGGGKLMVE